MSTWIKVLIGVIITVVMLGVGYKVHGMIKELQNEVAVKTSALEVAEHVIVGLKAELGKKNDELSKCETRELRLQLELSNGKKTKVHL